MELRDSVKFIKGVGPKKAEALARLGIVSVYDLLTYYPRTYEDRSVLTPLASLRPGGEYTVSGRILSTSERVGGRHALSILTAMIGDGTGFLQITWFNQKFLKAKLKPGAQLFATGRVEYAYGGRGQVAMSRLSSFEILEAGETAEERCGIEPIYAATEKLNQKYFRKILHELLNNVLPKIELPELITEGVRLHHRLMTRLEAFRGIHFPRSFEELKRARERLAFEELYLIQCGLMLLKKKCREEQRGVRHLGGGHLTRDLLAALPFALTQDQARAWQEISRDMESPFPMRRLLQGDVGSGKTVIALLALLKTVENGYQGAMMAPTEILASQHYENFTQMLSPLGVRVGFLSGRLTKKGREKIYAQMAAGELDIVVGTHALIEEGAAFKALGLAVTDEQHRFGIEQRAALEKKGALTPDVLVMTATPIPRTMTLTVYGDLDVSSIRELPPGRKPVRTFVRGPGRRELIYKYVRSQLEEGRQAYVVCPLIEPGEEEGRRSAEEVYEELRRGPLLGIPCALLHGRMKAAEKEEIMTAFYENKIKLLVSTTVIEVGVNVPNASIMVVEEAERFGLAQLHQLRGRIGRGEYQSFCILVSEGRTEGARERLAIMAKVADGFTLAEADLRLRGPGQFFGRSQHGLPDLKAANVLGDMAILLRAREAAQATLSDREAMAGILPVLADIYKEQFERIAEA